MFVGDGTHPLDKQFRIGRFFGIPLYVHIILVIFLAFELLSSLMRGNLLLMLSPMIIILSVYLHELGHALSSAYFGAQPRRIVLHLFGGVAEVPGGLRITQELWVIAWGPIVSLMLAILGYLLYTLWGSPGPLLYHVIYPLMMINIVLFVFNVLPIYPLDGGQLTRQWMVMRKGKTEAIRRSLPLSMATLIAAGMFGLVLMRGSFGILTLIIAIMLGFINHQEWMRHRHLFTDGFWRYLNPFGGSSSRSSPSSRSFGHLRTTEQDKQPQGGGLGDRLYVWWHRKQAEKIMRKSDEIGVDKLTPQERAILERYLDAKINLRRDNKYLH